MPTLSSTPPPPHTRNPQPQKDLSTLLPTAWVYWQAVEEPGSSWGLVQAPFKDSPESCELGATKTIKSKADAEKAVFAVPQFHVLRALIKAVPVGSKLFPLSPLIKRRGVGVWLAPGRVNYILVNDQNAKEPYSVRIDTSALQTLSAFKAAEAAIAQKAEAPKDVHVRLNVVDLDLVVIDRAGAEVGVGKREVEHQVAVGPEGTDVVVKPGHLIIVECTAV